LEVVVCLFLVSVLSDFQIGLFLIYFLLQMAMNAVRGLIRNTITTRNPVFRLMSARTQATSSAPAPASGSAADMLFTFASPAEVEFVRMKQRF